MSVRYAPQVEQMRRIAIRVLPELSDEALGAGETYRIERDGETVGFLIAANRVDPEASRCAFNGFDAMIERLRAGGGSQSDIEDAFDLTCPDSLCR